MKNKEFGLITSAILSTIVSGFTPEANVIEGIMLFCLLFIAYCKYTEDD